MSGLLDKARHTLLTDPVTGERLDTADRLSLACGLCVATLVIFAMLALSLGMGAGQ